MPPTDRDIPGSVKSNSELASQGKPSSSSSKKKKNPGRFQAFHHGKKKTYLTNFIATKSSNFGAFLKRPASTGLSEVKA